MTKVEKPLTSILARQSKSNLVRLAVAVLAGGGHVLQTVLFLAFGHPYLAVLSFAAVLVFVVMVWLVLRGQARLGGWVGYLEIVTQQIRNATLQRACNTLQHLWRGAVVRPRFQALIHRRRRPSTPLGNLGLEEAECQTPRSQLLARVMQQFSFTRPHRRRPC